MLITQQITPFIDIPSTSDPVNFATEGDNLLGVQLPAYQTEMNTWASQANAMAVLMNFNSTSDTSASSVAIGTGSKTFTVSASKSFQPGMNLIIADTSAPSTNAMFGTVLSYSGTTLVVDVLFVLGSGTKTAWTITQTLSGAGYVALAGNQTVGGVKTFSSPVGVASAVAAGDAVNLGQLAGSVIQTVSASYSTTASNSTSTYADTGLTATITPRYATSKILVIVSHQDCAKSVTNAASAVNMKLFRDAVDLGKIASASGYTGTALNLYCSIHAAVLDSPATASAIVYKTQFANYANAAAVSVQADGATGAPSTMTLLEIKQ